jgi:ParB family transcriptional regulator, chromosome partitioning protein
VPSDVKSSHKGLGKGFDALLPRDFDTSILLDPSDRVQKIKINLITPKSDQPRKHFEEESLGQLADSIKQFGVLQPIILVADGDKYVIIAGERRWRAAAIAKLDTVPAIVRSLKELEQLEIALVENVQRVDLSPLEQAASIEKLRLHFNMTYDTIAKRLGKANSTINNIARLLQLPPEAQAALQEQKITEGHARQLLSIKNTIDKQRQLLELIIKNNWSVRQAERFVTALKAAPKNVDSATVQERIKSETVETKQIGKQIKSKVSIRRTAHGGKVEIDFSTERDLQRVIKLLLSLK